MESCTTATSSVPANTNFMTDDPFMTAVLTKLKRACASLWLRRGNIVGLAG